MNCYEQVTYQIDGPLLLIVLRLLIVYCCRLSRGACAKGQAHEQLQWSISNAVCTAPTSSCQGRRPSLRDMVHMLAHSLQYQPLPCFSRSSGCHVSILGYRVPYCFNFNTVTAVILQYTLMFLHVNYLQNRSPTAVRSRELARPGVLTWATVESYTLNSV